MEKLQKRETALNMPKIRLASAVQRDSIVDGPGIRTVVWTQGCPHNCPGCHNPQTFAFDGGELVDVEDVIKIIKEAKLQNGVTFSGGDPMMQAKELLPIAKAVKELGLSLWSYTGFTYEALLKRPDAVELLQYIDVLVDGRFVLEEKTPYLTYKGSRNQRLIDVQESLKQGIVIISEYDKVNEGI